MTTKLKALQRAIRRLDGTADRPIARRNARRRVLAALRAVRAQVDRDFPALAVAKKPRAKGLRALGPYQFSTVEKAMRKRGFVVAEYVEAALFAAQGVRVRNIRKRLYVPTWASAIGSDKPDQLRAALKSVKLRRAALAAQALAQG